MYACYLSYIIIIVIIPCKEIGSLAVPILNDSNLIINQNAVLNNAYKVGNNYQKLVTIFVTICVI